MYIIVVNMMNTKSIQVNTERQARRELAVELIAFLGGPTKAAAKITSHLTDGRMLNRAVVGLWRTRDVPVAMLPAIELATNGIYTRKMFRPDLFS